MNNTKLGNCFPTLEIWCGSEHRHCMARRSWVPPNFKRHVHLISDSKLSIDEKGWIDGSIDGCISKGRQQTNEPPTKTLIPQTIHWLQACIVSSVLHSSKDKN